MWQFHDANNGTLSGNFMMLMVAGIVVCFVLCDIKHVHRR